MRIHFIAIGGAAMHSLAIAIKGKGHVVTGSDDEIFDPAKTHLQKHGLLPRTVGWHPEIITKDIDAVILGMHALTDNPELQKALELGLKVYSYPEFLYLETQDKTRVVVAGSHGKTTITSMIMHVLRYNGYKFDYMVGSKVEGFDNMVSLSHDNPIAVFEGDEYLSSCVDRRPKFHLYKPQLALITGIAWDHVNVFPTYEEYLAQFRIFIENLPADGRLVYCEEDESLRKLAGALNPKVIKEPYTTPDYSIVNGSFCISYEGITCMMGVFGRHNMQNMEGARRICSHLGVTDRQFFDAIASFKGAGKRLQLLGESRNKTVFLDFAHSPSKVEATVNAARELYSDRKVIACLELHTYSSLNKNFLVHYVGTMEQADDAIVFFNPDTIKHKRLPMITKDDVMAAFKKKDLKVFNNKEELEFYLLSQRPEQVVYLLMSSGNFSGIDFQTFSKELIK
jgi:UDP-N-acetylmuramate: L-alanyl-gamma-D-glutamyl-meso-diaminopimelate ligase